MIHTLIEDLGSDWALRALITSMLVGCTCGIIGCFIVLRNMSLIGDALSHSILPGIYFAFIIVGYSTVGFFMGSVLAGIVTAIAITWIQHNVKTKNDAAIGIVFTAMFSIGVMGISRLNNTQGNHLDLKDFLFGNTLGISTEDIYLSLIVMVYTVTSIVVFYRYFFITTFQPLIGETMGISTKAIHYFLMLMLSFAVVAALRSVGVILVVAMLITPASTAMLLSFKLKKILIYAALIGMLSSALGLALSIMLNTTPGPAMVIVATLIFLLAALFAKDRGLVHQWFNKRNEVRKIVEEDILKYLNKKERFDVNVIAQKLNYKISQIKYGIDNLLATSDIMHNGVLTIKGQHRAEELVRAHRLWETYQANNMGMKIDQIHADAERIEHHLSSEEVDEIESKLGFPEKDPHGSPIPKKKTLNTKALLNLKVKSRASISEKQQTTDIESELWELRLMPNTKFEVVKIDENNIYIISMGKEITIPSRLAMQILVNKI